MTLFERLKKIQWLDYYILGPHNHTFQQVMRNPFYGIKQLLSVKNINPHSLIDIRIGYKPYRHNMPVGAKKTLGEPWIRFPRDKKLDQKTIDRIKHLEDALAVN